MANPPVKTEHFQVSWYLGVVQYVHKIYQTAADVPKQNPQNMQRAPRFFFSKTDQHSNENGEESTPTDAPKVH